MQQGTVGFRVKSGWATVVLMAGPVATPPVLDHRVMGLSDPTIPGTKQPYHAARGALEQNSANLAKRVELVQQITKRSVRQLLNDYSRIGCIIRNAALVAGSLTEPNSIANPHIRAHALEGQLFRNAVEDALHSQGLDSLVVIERNAYAKASAILELPEKKLKLRVSDFSHPPGKPWRKDEKLAALAAWIAMAKNSPKNATERAKTL